MGYVEGVFRDGTDGEVGVHAEDFPDLAVGDGFADCDAEREVPRPDCFHEEEVLALCGVVEDLRLGGVDGEGFLAEDGLVVREAEHYVLEVVGVRCGDVDDVDVWVFGQLFVGAVGGAVSVGRVLLAFHEFRDEFLGAGFAGGAGDAGDEVYDVGYIAR